MGKNSEMSSVQAQNCLIALGSSLDHEKLTGIQLLVEAAEALTENGLVIRARSRDFRTPAFPAGSGPDFINAAAELISPFGPKDTLAALHRVEARFGRTRDVRWGARTLDLDLISYGEAVLPNEETHQYWRELPLDAQMSLAPQEMIVPHPRLAERGFVLVPLMDIAPDWKHPITGLTVKAMHAALPEAQLREVVPL